MMAEVKIKRTTNIILSITENEAIWLRNLVQNPIHTSLENELESERRIRESFWKVLKEV